LTRQIVPKQDRIQSLTGAPDTWPVEVHACIISYAAILVAKTSFSPSEIDTETARFMDATSSFSHEITENFRRGMTQENWPSMLSSVVAYMHREANTEALAPVPEDTRYLARLNAHILQNIRSMRDDHEHGAAEDEQSE